MTRLVLVAVVLAACSKEGSDATVTPGHGADAARLDDGAPANSTDGGSWTVSGDCAETYSTKISAAAFSIETHTFSKSFSLNVEPSIAPAITVWLCNFECFGASCTGALVCPNGYVCEEHGTPPPLQGGAAICTSFSGGAIASDGTFYVQCGYKQITDYTDPGTPDVVAGQTAHKVYLNVH